MDQDSSTIADQSSVSEIKRRQNINCGLTVISDPAFNFFLELDRTKQLETVDNLNEHGADFVIFMKDKLQNDEALHELWSNLFSIRNDVTQMMYAEVVQKFLNMSNAQFQREFKHSLRTEKKEAHRKQIKISKSEKNRQFNIGDITKDSSLKKIASNRRLQSEIEADSKFLNKFTKAGLASLCQMHAIKYRKASKKESLIGALQDHILCCNQVENPDMSSSNKHTNSSSPPNHEQGPNLSTGSQPSEYPTSVEPQPSTSSAGDFRPYPEEIQNSKTKRKNTTRQNKLLKARQEKRKCIKWPCGLCGESCLDDCIECNACTCWHHFDCLGATGDEPEFEAEVWLCKGCLEGGETVEDWC